MSDIERQTLIGNLRQALFDYDQAYLVKETCEEKLHEAKQEFEKKHNEVSEMLRSMQNKYLAPIVVVK